MFMWPRKFGPQNNERIRRAACLGSAPCHGDHERYEKSFAHCYVLVVGAGPSGLAAAHAAAKASARVMLVEDRPELGGSLLADDAEIAGMPGMQWVEQEIGRAHV